MRQLLVLTVLAALLLPAAAAADAPKKAFELADGSVVVGVVVDEAFHRRNEDREGRAEVVRGLLAARLGVFDPHLELAVGDLEVALGTVVKLRTRAL